MVQETVPRDFGGLASRACSGEGRARLRATWCWQGEGFPQSGDSRSIGLHYDTWGVRGLI